MSDGLVSKREQARGSRSVVADGCGALALGGPGSDRSDRVRQGRPGLLCAAARVSYVSQDVDLVLFVLVRIFGAMHVLSDTSGGVVCPGG
jgi:hypothetical protein